MKQTLKTLIRNVKSINGNSLAEFATTTALMATLAATAAPKLSEMSEGAKAEKSRNEIDKMIKQAGQFYQDKAATAPEGEGRGRFPGQSKFNESVGHGTAAYSNSGATSAQNTASHTASDAHRLAIETDLGTVAGEDGWRQYNDTPTATWESVFGTSNADNPSPSGAAPTSPTDATSKIVDKATGAGEWKELFGDEVMGSTFQDGHYVYSVVAGGGSGEDVYPPVLYVADIENATDFNNLLEP